MFLMEPYQFYVCKNILLFRCKLSVSIFIKIVVFFLHIFDKRFDVQVDIVLPTF